MEKPKVGMMDGLMDELLVVLTVEMLAGSKVYVMVEKKDNPLAVLLVLLMVEQLD